MRTWVGQGVREEGWGRPHRSHRVRVEVLGLGAARSRRQPGRRGLGSGGGVALAAWFRVRASCRGPPNGSVYRYGTLTRRRQEAGELSDGQGLDEEAVAPTWPKEDRRSGKRHHYENGQTNIGSWTTADGCSFRDFMLMCSSVEVHLKQLSEKGREVARVSDKADWEAILSLNQGLGERTVRDVPAEVLKTGLARAAWFNGGSHKRALSWCQLRSA